MSTFGCGAAPVSPVSPTAHAQQRKQGGYKRRRTSSPVSPVSSASPLPPPPPPISLRLQDADAAGDPADADTDAAANPHDASNRVRQGALALHAAMLTAAHTARAGAAEGFDAEWPVVCLQQLRRQAQAPAHDAAVWLACQRAARVDPERRRAAVEVIYDEAHEWACHAETAHGAVALLDAFLAAAAPAAFVLRPDTDDDEGASDAAARAGASGGAGAPEAALAPAPAPAPAPALTPTPTPTRRRRLASLPGAAEQTQRRVALACLWTACKLSEATVPAVAEVVGVLRTSYNDTDVFARDVVAWERHVTRTLDYTVNLQTPCRWLGLLALLTRVSVVTHDLALYLLDLSAGNSCALAHTSEARAWAALVLAHALLQAYADTDDASDDDTDAGGSTQSPREVHATLVAALTPAARAAVVLEPAWFADAFAFLARTTTRAHAELRRDSGVYLGHVAHGSFCSPLTLECTRGAGFPNTTLAVELLRTGLPRGSFARPPAAAASPASSVWGSPAASTLQGSARADASSATSNRSTWPWLLSAWSLASASPLPPPAPPPASPLPPGCVGSHTLHIP